jgi:hypothetical protein
MMGRIYLLLAFAGLLAGCAQNQPSTLTGRDLIEKSISYHDPKGDWSSLKASFVIQDSLPPGRDSRFYAFSLDNSQSKFIYRINGLHYQVWNDSVEIFEGEVENARALRMRNYYTYLWGLPMKLRDEGTVIEDSVRKEMLNGKEYQVVRVPYEKDIWYFYMDPETYRMEAYKFYQDEPNLKGEIIFLDQEFEYKGMKIPQNRSWFRTEKEEFLGTDKLLEIKPLLD